MMRKRLVLALVIAGLFGSAFVYAAANGLVQSALTGGGGRDERDGAVLNSSVGQPIAGRSESGSAVLCAGWPGCREQGEEIALQADFSATPLTGAAPLTVTFTNLSSGSLESCEWDFGDGAGSEACEAPQHTYNAAGVYTVTLTVHGGGQTDTRVRSDYILVSDEEQVYLPLVLEGEEGEVIGDQ